MEGKTVRKRRKPEESFKEKIERLFEYGIDTQAESDHPFLRISSAGIGRDIYFGSTITNVDFVTFNEKKNNNDKIARLELRTCLFEDEDEMIVGSDENTDFRSAANAACEYESKYSKHFFDKCYGFEKRFYLCEVHTLYVSEEYRGNGLAKYFLMMIPGILDALLNYEYYDGIIVAHINPWEYQGSLNTKSDNERDVIYMDNPDEEMIKRMQKPLTQAGFKKISERDYCIRGEKLQEYARKRELDFSYKGCVYV